MSGSYFEDGVSVYLTQCGNPLAKVLDYAVARKTTLKPPPEDYLVGIQPGKGVSVVCNWKKPLKQPVKVVISRDSVPLIVSPHYPPETYFISKPLIIDVKASSKAVERAKNPPKSKAPTRPSFQEINGTTERLRSLVLVEGLSVRITVSIVELNAESMAELPEIYYGIPPPLHSSVYKCYSEDILDSTARRVIEYLKSEQEREFLDAKELQVGHAPNRAEPEGRASVALKSTIEKEFYQQIQDNLKREMSDRRQEFEEVIRQHFKEEIMSDIRKELKEELLREMIKREKVKRKHRKLQKLKAKVLDLERELNVKKGSPPSQQVGPGSVKQQARKVFSRDEDLGWLLSD